MGFDLPADIGTARLSWRRLLLIVENSAEDSAVTRSVNPVKPWSPEMQMLTNVFDALAILIWMQSKDGASGRNRPRPTPRPGMKDPNVEHFGDASMTLNETRAWLEAKNGER